MDFEKSKENILPLSTGRNVGLLQASLRTESTLELASRRAQFENEIKNYKGDDPLEVWYNYISWIEQSYPSGGSESGLHKVMRECLSAFENSEQYKQDPRLIKLFIKFMQNQQDQAECYQQMFKCGIGTLVADLYIAWAYSYDINGDARKADEIFCQGLKCLKGMHSHSDQYEALNEAHKHYGFAVCQRLLYRDTEKAAAVDEELNERRRALQSLRGTVRSKIGSIRTGGVVASQTPGTLPVNSASTVAPSSSNRRIEVFKNENADEVPATTDGQSGILSIIDAARHQENFKEPAPWRKGQGENNHKRLFAGISQTQPTFNIHVDEELPEYERPLKVPIPCDNDRYRQGIRYPKNFIAKNKPQSVWNTPITTEDRPEPNTVPCYNKVMLYPRPNMEFQPEEWLAFCYFKRSNIEHPYVKRHAAYWSKNDANANVRRYPNFASSSVSSSQLTGLDKYYKPERPTNAIQVQYDEVYNDDEQEEFQLEELRARKWRESRNTTINNTIDMEETVCLPDEQLPRRKSFFPAAGRKSLAPSRGNRLAGEHLLPSRCSIVMENEDEAGSNVEQKPTAPAEDFPAPRKSILKATGSVQQNSLPNVPTINVSPNAFFESDDCCSTQQFNINLKSQPSSTPKAQAKVPLMQEDNAGTLLLEQRPPIEPEEGHSLGETTPPQRQQLSTIFEMSEYSTTQGTTQTTSSTTSSASSGMTKSTIHVAATPARTPAASRVPGALTARFEPSPAPMAAGNFSRLDQREDTTDFGAVPKTLRFQEDKTETMTKSVLRFQDDKTEPMPAPKMLSFNPLNTPARGGNESNALFSPMPMPPPVLTPDDSDDIDNIFLTASPQQSKSLLGAKKKQNVYASPIVAEKSAKRVCDQETPEAFRQKPKLEINPAHVSFTIFEDELERMKNYMAENSSIRSTISPLPPNVDVQTEDQPGAVQNEAGPIEDKKPASGNVSHASSSNAVLAPSIPPNPLPFDIFNDSVMKDAESLNEVVEMPPPANIVEQPKFDIFVDSFVEPENKTKPSAQAETQATVARLRLASEGDKENAPSVSLIKQLERRDTLIDDSFIGGLNTSPKQADHLTLSYMKDFSELGRTEKSAAAGLAAKVDDLSANISRLSFLRDASKQAQMPPYVSMMDATQCKDGGEPSSKNSPYFEFNAATEMFATNISMIKNSTFLPREDLLSPSNVEKKSLTELMPPPPRISVAAPTANISLTKSRAPVPSVVVSQSAAAAAADEVDKPHDELSIYYKNTPKTPQRSMHSWEDSLSKISEKNDYVHPECNRDNSVQILPKSSIDPNANPFSSDHINSFLESIDFVNYIEDLSTCELVGHVKRLHACQIITVNNERFDVLKMIGEGAYGSVFCGTQAANARKVALKQERPANLWEYYICLEVQTRLVNEDMLSAFMSIDYALIGNNCSVLISEFSPYGSLIAVANKLKKHTTKNIDEYVVMLLASQLLHIIDHLHGTKIIHADVKPDNFLLMKPLTYPSNEISLQLIDFGVSIDMQSYPENQTFKYTHSDDAFKCVEMRTQRPWVYQLDLYGLAGIIHVLLHGRYMEIEQRLSTGFWMPKTHMPRYLKKDLWETIFERLLNIPDCKTMPDLQKLRCLLKTELAENGKFTGILKDFNRILCQ